MAFEFGILIASPRGVTDRRRGFQPAWPSASCARRADPPRLGLIASQALVGPDRRQVPEIPAPVLGLSPVTLSRPSCWAATPDFRIFPWPRALNPSTSRSPRVPPGFY